MADHVREPHSSWRPPQPRAIPELRRSLIAHLSTTAFVESMTEVISGGDHLLSSQDMPAREGAQWVAATGIHQLKQARMLSVDRDMSNISVAAAQRLPTFELRPENHPSPFGLMVFDRPIASTSHVTLGVVAASWGQVLTSEGLGTWMMFWAAVNHEHAIQFVRESRAMSREEAERVVYGATADLVVCQDVFFLHRDPDPLPAAGIDPDHPIAWAQIVRSAWAMYTARSKRRIAVVEEVPAPRPERRDAERQGYLHTSHVDVIRVHPRLRARAAREHTTGDQHTGWKIDYRKFVSSHIRWQPYPSRNTVEPILIEEFVQGPPGAPFKTKREKVYRLDNKSQPPPHPLVR